MVDSRSPLSVRVGDHCNRFIPLWKRQMKETKDEIKYAKLKRLIEEAELVKERLSNGYYAKRDWIPKKPIVVRVSDAL